MKRIAKTVAVNLLHYLFWMALFAALWAYLFILKPQSGTMFRYVGF